MTERKLTAKRIAAFEQSPRTEKRAPGTVEKYLRDVRAFALWLESREVTRETGTGYPEVLPVAGGTPLPDLNG
nr:hypothetical protein [uncultured Oscillibacter sp.]